MFKKIFLLFVLAAHGQVKPLVGEMIIGAALYKVATSRIACVLAGYALSSQPGKRIITYGRSKLFPFEIGAGKISSGVSSKDLNLRCESYMEKFRDIPNILAAVKARASELSFKKTDAASFAAAGVDENPSGSNDGAKNNFYAQQNVYGLFPRVTNNYYHSGSGKQDFWKGAFVASNGAWVTALCFSKNPEEKSC